MDAYLGANRDNAAHQSSVVALRYECTDARIILAPNFSALLNLASLASRSVMRNIFWSLDIVRDTRTQYRPYWRAKSKEPDRVQHQKSFPLGHWIARLMPELIFSNVRLISRGGRLTIRDNVCHLSEDLDICPGPMRRKVISSIDVQHLIMPVAEHARCIGEQDGMAARQAWALKQSGRDCLNAAVRDNLRRWGPFHKPRPTTDSTQPCMQCD